VAIGICAATGGIFRECYNVSGGIDKIIPGRCLGPRVCSTAGNRIIDGVVTALGILEQKRLKMLQKGNSDSTKVGEA